MRLSARIAHESVALGLVFASVFSACGARTSLLGGEATEPPKPCNVDSDCDEHNLCAPEACVSAVCRVTSRVNCDDGDPCTTDTCDPKTGACSSVPNTPDADHDGFRAPLPGHAPGDPGSCGDDCNDNNPNVHPGALELCNGIDDNCNGAIDEGSVYVPAGSTAVQVSSSSHPRALAGGFAYDGKEYGLFYSGKDQQWNGYFRGLDVNGGVAIDDVDVTRVNADTYSGPIIWTGTQYGVAWTDTRLGDNYEVYFNRLDHEGKKFARDLRVTDAPDFSLHPSLLWTGQEFSLVWDDRRPDSGTSPPDNAAIYGQRLSDQGVPIGGNVKLVPRELGAEYPIVALGTSRLGIVYTTLVSDAIGLGFTSVSTDMSDIGQAVDLASPDAHNPTLAWVSDRFIVAWDVYGDAPGNAIWGAAVDEKGTVQLSPRPLTSGARYARTVNLVSLGDRFIMLWADDFDGNFELYSKTLSADFSEITPRVRLTNDPADTLGPTGALGPMGELGVVFDDWRGGVHQLWFTHLSCTTVGH